MFHRFHNISIKRSVSIYLTPLWVTKPNNIAFLAHSIYEIMFPINEKLFPARCSARGGLPRLSAPEEVRPVHGQEYQW